MSDGTSTSTLYTIADVAERFGLTLRTLRFYEEKGLLSPTRRGLERIYSPTDLLRIQIIFVGKRLGFSILEIKKLMDRGPDQDAMPGTIGELRLTKAEVEQRIKMLVEQRDRLEENIAELKKTSRDLLD